MSDNSLPPAIRTGERHGRWISWMTLVAGAVLCVVAVLEKIGMTCLGLRQLEGHDEPSTYFEIAP